MLAGRACVLGGGWRQSVSVSANVSACLMNMDECANIQHTGVRGAVADNDADDDVFVVVTTALTPAARSGVYN